jgi:hypothetical protein
MKPALISSSAEPHTIPRFDNNVRVDNGILNGRSTPDNGAGKKNRVTDFRTGFQNHA